MRELRYALRRLAGSPLFTIAATLTLAIAIAATASVFGLVDGVLLKAFPYRHPDRVLDVRAASTSSVLRCVAIAQPTTRRLKASSTTARNRNPAQVGT